jgi:hypothetical protein
MRLKLRFTELVNFFDEMTNVAKENMKYISLCNPSVTEYQIQ